MSANRQMDQDPASTTPSLRLAAPHRGNLGGHEARRSQELPSTARLQQHIQGNHREAPTIPVSVLPGEPRLSPHCHVHEEIRHARGRTRRPKGRIEGLTQATSLHEGFRFRGFHSPNYTQVPDELFDELLAVLSGAELKVVLYVIRRTFGFKRESDNISLSQMLRGIRTKDPAASIVV